MSKHENGVETGAFVVNNMQSTILTDIKQNEVKTEKVVDASTRVFKWRELTATTGVLWIDWIGGGPIHDNQESSHNY